MKTFVSKSVGETQKIAEEWLESISVYGNSGDSVAGAIVVALNGHLGSGKTTFVQSVARALGTKESVTSPTFVLMKIYDIESSQFKRLVHIDAYRLENGDQLSALNFEQVVADPNNIVLIEWAENVKEGLPDNVMVIEFEYEGENERRITFK